MVGVNPSRLRQWWNSGVLSNTDHLFLLLIIADSIGLRDGIRMCPDRDLPEYFDLEGMRL